MSFSWTRDLELLGGTIVSAAAESVQVNLFEGVLPNYACLTSFRHPWIDLWRRQKINVFCLEESENDMPVTTRDLLQAPSVSRFLRTLKPPVRLLVFKSDVTIESFCKRNNLVLLSAPAAIARVLENKLNFPDIAKTADIRNIPTEATCLDADLNYFQVADRFGPNFILQFAKGFSGNKTYLIRCREELDSIKDEFFGRKCRVTRWIDGPTWTCNGCTDRWGHTNIGTPFFQVTKLRINGKNIPSNIGSRGNLWLRPPEPEEQVISLFMKRIGQYLSSSGYYGMFGADFITDASNGLVYGVEINPRLVASVPALTPMEITAGEYPLLVDHILAAAGQPIIERNQNNQRYTGGQIIIRDGDQGDLSELQEMKSGVYLRSKETPMLDLRQCLFHRTEWSNSRILEEEILLWTSERNPSPFNEKARLFFNVNEPVPENLLQIIG